MILHTDWRNIPASARNTVAALGNFDGVHRGHVHLLDTLRMARPDHPLSVVTFDPHPRTLFRPQDPPFRLMLPDVRAAALGAQGVDHVFQIPFDAVFSRLSADRFVNDVLVNGLGVAHVACGADFAFGHRRTGNIERLEALLAPHGIGLTIVPQLSDEGGPISSSRIRRLLQEGYPQRAAQELGRPWSITGPVMHGDQRGRLLGFPTANIPLTQHVEPARGVYAARVTLPDGRVIPGVANIGRRPTINDGQESRLEVHLFDFNEDLYGQTLSVALIALLREEKKFSGLDELKAQIAADAVQARVILGV
ncbi:bifunctional riboflavin kinase/FAD synthetase [Gluconobacter roseus]|uniref:Riboflavin biosynthesis protein n=1 Tax=Gluconobacter roseus NBRC 3990 TaxID=1307950 RepID=A0A4Y3MAM1_9PROT|nr:bifunctional riboflavin kinase/FAD synthetase [Gluconobacter roseus]KXV44674.1 riboflavin kinase [Gluconobacter roseus]GBR43584.1 riboflavin kinase RibF [Gluconobacter roseus NBRC 3990]GEB04936.1 riboflavin biosynthesis protein [Gluconobacter roseus NBRC 3990]GLP94518.1 riboflavin biosynthesis protein [Gluconobacter roseus NBRC 3990]